MIVIKWEVRPRQIANEDMFEVIGFDGKKETYGGLFATREQAQGIADRLNTAQEERENNVKRNQTRGTD